MKKIKTKIIYFINIFLLTFLFNNYSVFANSNFNNTGFTINVWSLFKWLIPTLNWQTVSSQANTFFWRVIDLLLSWIWVFAFFVMVIWAWYMILSSWNESWLSKWKKMFYLWLWWLAVALSSYYIMNLVRAFIYQS